MSDAPPPPPAPVRRRWLPWAIGGAAVLASAGLLASLPFTERGSAWLLRGAQALLPGLTLESPRGPLLGDFAAARLVWQLNAGQQFVIEQIRWRQPRFEHDRFWGLHLRSLGAARAAIEGTAPPSTVPSPLPTQLRLPVSLEIDQVQVDRFDLPALPGQPLRDLRFALQLRAGEQVRHELRQLSLRWERLQAQGSASIGADAPMLLKAQLKLRNDAAAPGTSAPALLAEEWQAQLQATGGLTRFRVQGRLRARGQSVDAEALVRPGNAVPIENAEARMEGFDLAGLSRQWPRTALAGLVMLRLGTETRAAPLQIEAQLRNDAAGPWADGTLPVRELQLSATTALKDFGQGELQQLVLEVGSRARSGGRLQGQGLWQTQGRSADRTLDLRLQTRLQGLRPAELDPHAPPIELSGPARLEWQQPWPEGGSANGLGTGRLQADWTGRGLRPLAGSSGNPTVRLQLDAEGTPTLLTLRHFEASAGPSSWIATGSVRRDGTAWALQLQSTLQAFDPALWLGSLASLPPSRIDAQLNGQLRWFDAPFGSAWQNRLRGDAALQIQPSVLAGVPGRGELQLHSAGTLQADGRLALGSADAAEPPVNLTLQGRLDPQSGAAARDQWQLRWTARALETLAPWLHALPGRPDLAGAAQGDLTLDGRWPRLAARGQLQASSLQWRSDRRDAATPTTSVAQDAARAAEQVIGAAQQAVGAPPTKSPSAAAMALPPSPAGTPATGRNTLALRDLQAQWQLGSQPGDAFLLDLRVAQAQTPALRLRTTTLQGEGRMDRHTLRAQTTALPSATAGPPQTTASDTATTPDDGLPWTLQLAADGGWQLGEASRGTSSDALSRRPGGGAPWGWQGQLSQLQARRNASPAATQTAVTLRTEPAPLAVLRDDAGLRAGYGPTRLQVNDAVFALDALRYESTPAGASLDLRAQLQPSALAPLLTVAQPGFGWRGDLQVAGQVQVQARPGSFDALVELNRERGDLAVEDLDLGTGARPLGLTDLHLRLAARNGRWTLRERIAGTRMGRLDGEISATTGAADWVPRADAPLRGRLDLDVAQLGFWGAWLPTGWRLGGQLTAQAQVGGQVGAPRLDGEVRGQRIAVRNVLQGIDWRDAELQARLAGDAVLLERLSMHAGGGTLTVNGRATLGTAPTIELQARAERFAALQRVDRRVVASGQAALQVDASRLRLTGQLRADEGHVDFSQAEAPGLSADVDVRRNGTGDSPVDTRQRGPQRALQLDLRADLGPQFRLTGRGLNTRLAGELRLTSPNNRPQLQGTIRAEEGTYAAYGQKLGIDRGLISFSGPIENPRLDVQATRSDLEGVKVGVVITGTAQTPRVRLYSDPDMSDTDKLSYLLMGRPSDGLGRTDLALLQRAAYALLSGEGDGPSLVQRIGLDNLSVSQNDAGTVQQTVVSLGKQLSRRWYLGYERSLQATTGTWLLTYKLAQRFTVRAQSGYQNALDLIWSWRWGLGE